MAKKKNKGIRLSEKHGVNPSLIVCMLCGKETGAIALLGKLKGDAEAPKYIHTGDICDNCKKKLEDEKQRVFVNLKENKYITLPDSCLSKDYLSRVKDTRVIYLPADNFKIIEDELKKASMPEEND